MKNKIIVIIVLLILVVIAAFIPSTRTTTPKHQEELINRSALAECEVLDVAISQYLSKFHKPPEYGTNLTLTLFNVGVLKRDFQDPWGKNYIFTTSPDNQNPIIISSGKDRELGTDDDLKYELKINPKQVDPIVKSPVDEVEAQGTQGHP